MELPHNFIVIKLVEGFDPNQDQKISFEEFVNVMKSLENRINYENPNVSKKVDALILKAQLWGQEKTLWQSVAKARSLLSPWHLSSRIPQVIILYHGWVINRLLNDFQKKREKDLNYMEAKRAKEKF